MPLGEYEVQRVRELMNTLPLEISVLKNIVQQEAVTRQKMHEENKDIFDKMEEKMSELTVAVTNMRIKYASLNVIAGIATAAIIEVVKSSMKK